jgi:hypothetical protein
METGMKDKHGVTHSFSQSLKQGCCVRQDGDGGNTDEITVREAEEFGRSGLILNRTASFRG